MRRRSSVEPSKNLPSQVLHPTLQAALERLDVQLDEELSRYRRLRVHQPRQTNRRQRLRQPDMVAVSASGGRTQPQAAGQPVPAPAPPAMTGEQHPVQPEPVMSMAIASHLSTAEPGELASSTGSDIAADAKAVAQTLANQDDLGPDSYLESSEELLKSIAEEEALRAEREPGLLESLLTPLGIGSMLLLLLSSVTFGYVIMNPSSLNLLGAQRPSGNTNTNSAVSNASPNAANNTPVASAGNSDALAGPDLTSQEFKDLNLNTLSTIPPNSTVRPTTLPSVSAPTTPGNPAPANPAANPVSPNPSINTAMAPAPAAIPQVSVPRQVPAAQQAPATDTPRRATNTPARSSTRRAAQSERATTPVRRSRPVAQPSTERPSAVTRRSPSTSSSQASRSTPVAPPAAAPARTSRPASPEPARAAQPASAPASQSDRYYVVTRYNSDRSLTQARQAVGDAYVRNFPSGAQVQLGVFSERQRAQQLMQDLQQQGISAEVYQP